MTTAKKLSLLMAICLVAGFTVAAQDQGPKKEGSETVARPRKKDSAAEPATEAPKIPSKFERKNPADIPQGTPSFRADVTSVTVDVAVLDNKGRFIPNIPRGNFRILEDNVPQQVKTFSTGEAPMTVAIVVEFSNRWQRYWSETWYQTLTAAYGFIQTLKPEDYVALIAYDMRPEILCDFTDDKRAVYEAMRRLQIAAFSESNLFDALTYTAERMTDIETRKAIVLLSSGDDTFSRLTFDKTRKILQDAGVPIYAIGLARTYRELLDAYGYTGPIARMDFLQAENQLRTFTKETGGQFYNPRFYGEFPSIFASIADALRHQYNLTYNPSNQTRDGSVRKLKVELVNPQNGEPLRIVDEKGKPIKYSIIAKNAYTAPRQVE
jgi:Ca-activated chloride channel homolog